MRTGRVWPARVIWHGRSANQNDGLASGHPNRGAGRQWEARAGLFDGLNSRGISHRSADGADEGGGGRVGFGAQA